MLLFLKDTVSELKKLVLPSKKETYVTTITVLVSVTIASLVIMFADFLISKIIKIIFGL
jgi:preprotein translocase SecE subunit